MQVPWCSLERVCATRQLQQQAFCYAPEIAFSRLLALGVGEVGRGEGGDAFISHGCELIGGR